MTIEGGEARPDGPGAWIVHAPPGAPIVATYRVVSAYDHDPTDDDSRQSKPVIRPTWFYSVGEALFARPEDQEKAPATFVWEGAPAGFGFASDLEHLGRPGGKAARPGTVKDVLESVVAGGRDLRLVDQRIDGTRLRVAVLGRYDFDSAAFARQAFAILKAERDFWRDRGQPFLVTMSPTLGSPGRLSYGGTGRTDAFALWVDTTTSLADLRWLLAHEYFHTWNPLALGNLAEDENEPAGYWFSEGFTDYYAWKLMLASGLFGPNDFADKWNDGLRAYATSSVRAEPNSRIVADFWKSQEVQKLPYQRGAILAATLDRQALERGSSLDDVMREMRRLAAAPGETRHADVLFPVAYQAVTGLDPQPLIERHVIRGEPQSLAPGVFGPCFKVKTLEAPVFERGWDSEATRAAGMLVTGLRDDTAAYAAGLRNGMKILEFKGLPGDPTVPYLLKVKPADGPDQLITFMPAGKGRISMQKVEPVADCPKA